MGRIFWAVCLVWLFSCTQECPLTIKPSCTEFIIVETIETEIVDTESEIAATETTDQSTTETEIVDTESEIAATETTDQSTTETETTETEIFDTETIETETFDTETVETDTYDIHTVKMECRGRHEIWACPENKDCVLHEICPYETHYCWKDPDDNRAYCLEVSEETEPNIDAQCIENNPQICIDYDNDGFYDKCEVIEECTENQVCQILGPLSAKCIEMPPH